MTKNEEEEDEEEEEDGSFAVRSLPRISVVEIPSVRGILRNFPNNYKNEYLSAIN